MKHRMNLLGAGVLAVCLFAATPALAMDTPDAWITTKVKMSLLTSDGISTANDVNVDTVDGRVTLHGLVPSDAEKVKAEDTARTIDGVKEVRNLLQVVPSSAVKAVKISDDKLEKNVKAVLKRDKALESSDIDIASVHDGVVLLSGSAKTLSVHRRAIEDARAVPGVLQVSSEIKSPDRLSDEEISMGKGTSKSESLTSAAHDTWITTAAKSRLLATSDVPALDINVDTEHSVVTLFGTVPTDRSKQLAETEVKKVDGVRAVRNDLQVVPKSMAKDVSDSDANITKNIDNKLGQRSELKDGKIDVQVENGVARLKGNVASQSDRMLAMTTTRGVPGVRSVIDDLTVSSH